MPVVPTYKELVDRSNSGLWLDKGNVQEILECLSSLPDPSRVGDTAIIELVSLRYGCNLGWAILHPDAEEWVFVSSKNGDKTIDTKDEQ